MMTEICDHCLMWHIYHYVTFAAYLYFSSLVLLFYIQPYSMYYLALLFNIYSHKSLSNRQESGCVLGHQLQHIFLSLSIILIVKSFWSTEVCTKCLLGILKATFRNKFSVQNVLYLIQVQMTIILIEDKSLLIQVPSDYPTIGNPLFLGVNIYWFDFRTDSK